MIYDIFTILVLFCEIVVVERSGDFPCCWGERRRRNKRCRPVSWARRCGEETGEGRLGSQVDKEFANFTSSLTFDKNLFKYDIVGSIAHTKMLSKQGIISEEEAEAIVNGLREIFSLGYNALELRAEYEDIHIAVEAKLKELVGSPALKLHTARSRNDQVALDLRMLTRDEIISLAKEIIAFERVLLSLASEHTETLMPGYTHLQIAQPATVAHHLLAHFNILLRDLERLRDSFSRVNISPLGACALATTSFPIDKNYTAELLGFEASFENSQDAVASRDFLLEAMACSAISAINLTRICEEIILWSTGEFNFVELPEALSSTSSIMPQKKNPDALEIIRAKASIAAGNLTSGLMLTKALPLAYNRDLQELSPVALNSLRVMRESFSLLSKLFKGLKFRKEALKRNLERGFSTATELADFLVREKKLSFREAHQIVGRAVLKAESTGKISLELIEEASLEILGRKLEIQEKELEDVLDPMKAVLSRKVEGSPSPEHSMRAISRGEEKLKLLENYFTEKEKIIKKAFKELLGD